MCLIIPSSQEPVVTAEDMTVYKMVLFDAGGADPNQHEGELTMVYAFFKKFKYEIGKMYEAEILPTTEVSNFDMIATAALKKEIGIRHRADRLVYSSLKQCVADGSLTCYGPGLHSCATPDRLSMPWSPGRLRKQTEYYGIIGVPGVAIVECTIPAGSTVITDTSGCIVSNRLTVNRVHRKNKYQVQPLETFKQQTLF